MMIFVPKYVSRKDFKGGILGGARQFWGNPCDVFFPLHAISGPEQWIL